MGEPLKKVKSGDPLRIPADTFNSFIDAARHHRDNQRSTSADMTDGGPRDFGRTKLKNQSGADRRRFEVLQLGNPLFGPDDNLLEYINHTSFAGLAIAEDGEDRVAILQEPAPSGRIRDAIYAGVSIVCLTGDTGNKRATTREDEFVLVTGEHGPFTVLHDPGPANQERLGVVRFGAAASNETVFFEITSISQAPPDQDCGCAGPGIIFNAQVLYEACGTDAPEQIQVSDLCGAYFEGDPEELIGRRGTAVRMRRKLTGGDPEDCCCWVLISLCPPDEDSSDDSEFTEETGFPTGDTQHQSFSEETEESEFPTDTGTEDYSNTATEDESEPDGSDSGTGTGDFTGDETGTGTGTGDGTGTGTGDGTGTEATGDETGTEDGTDDETGSQETEDDTTTSDETDATDEESGSGTASDGTGSGSGTDSGTGSGTDDGPGTGTGDGPDPPDTGTGEDGTEETGDTGETDDGPPPATGTDGTDSDGSDSDGTGTGTGSGTGDGTGETGEPPGTGDETGSDKSTAIVPAAWSPTGYAALFVAECPEVRFDDVIVVHVPQVDGQVPIDARYIAVCEPGSLEVCGTQADLPVPVGAQVAGECVRLRFAEQCPGQKLRLVIRLTGIRRGFADVRFPTRTARQFAANERFIRSAYPDE